MNPDIQQLESRVAALEEKAKGTPFDPQSDKYLDEFVTLDYFTTVPTWTPTKNGVEVLVKSGGLYYLYVYVDGGWHSSQIGTTAAYGRSYLSSNQGITNNFNTKVTFDTNDYASGITWDAANNRFTALTAGKYLVSTSLQWSSPTTNFSYYTRIYKNGAEVSRATFIPGNFAGFASQAVSDIVSLAVNDYVEVFALQASGGTVNITGSSPTAFLAITKIA